MSKISKKIGWWGIMSLVLGLLSIPVLINGAVQFVLGIGAMACFFIQKKIHLTKLAIGGLIVASISVFGSYLIAPGFKLIALIFLILAFLFPKAKKLIKGKKLSKWSKKIFIFSGVLISLIFALFIYGLTTNKCKTKDCFVGHAKYCNAATLKIEEKIGTIKYKSSYQATAPSGSSCALTKTIVKLHESESQFMKDFLEGKSTSCKYGVGSVNSNWVYSLITDLDQCSEEGGLKKAIGDLVLFVE